MKLIEIILYPFKEEKFLIKISQPLIIFVVIGYVFRFLKINTATIDAFNLASELLILGYIYIFANNIINNVVPAIPDFIKDFLRILKHGFIGAIVIKIYLFILILVTSPITITLAVSNKILIIYLVLIPLTLLIIPIAFCMYSYKLSFKESLKTTNIKTTIKAIWGIKFLYLKYIAISILLIILLLALGVIIYIFLPVAEELHSKPSIFLIGLICASIFANLFKNKVLNKLEIK